MTFEQFLVDVLRNSPVLVSSLLILWLSLPQLAERFTVVGKILAPFSKKSKQRAKDARDAAEKDRQTLLADAQAVAQTTATKATTDALVVVTRQCKECRDELTGLRGITGHLIDAIEEVLPMVPVKHRSNARAAIRLARNAM